MCTQTGLIGLYLICIIWICIIVIIKSHAYALKRQKRPNTQPKASMCVQTGLKGLSSHLYLCMPNLVPKGQMHPNTWPMCVLRRAPKIYISTVSSRSVSLLSSNHMHMPPKDRSAQTHRPKSLCVFRWTSKASHLICITVSGGE